MKARPPSTDFWSALRGDRVPTRAWPELVTRARREGILPYLAARQTLCPGRSLIRREASLAHLSRIALYRRVISTLEHAAIPWIAVKGLAAAQQLYDDPADRPSGDCDVLVRPDDRDAATAALRNAGFLPTPHHAELFIGESGEVDLHTHAVNRERVTARAELRITEPDWFAGRRFITSEAGDLPVLADDHLAIFLSLHLVHHHGGVGARWLVDLHRLLASHPTLVDPLSRGLAGRAGGTVLYLERSLWPTDDLGQAPTVGERAASIAPAPTHDTSVTPAELLDSITLAAAVTPVGLLDRITLAAARDGEDVPGLRFLHTLRELPASARTAFLMQTLLPDRDVLDAVAVPRAARPFPLHIRRLVQTAFSLTRLAWQAINSPS